MSNQITIETPDGKRAGCVDGSLTLVDEEPEDVMERIKTFEDALAELGEQNRFVQDWEEADATDFTSPDILAYLKLRVICAALNEGWQPTFGKDEWRYFPWFYIYSKEELDEMSKEERSRVVGRSVSNSFAFGCLVVASARGASSDSSTVSGSRLAFKTEELAIYAGKQFVAIWTDYICA